MILKLSLFYQIIFNTYQFLVIVPFIKDEKFFEVSILYLAATIPSFLLTIPLNNFFKFISLKTCCIICVSISSLFSFGYFFNQQLIVGVIILSVRSCVGSIFIPKLCQYYGTLSIEEQNQSKIILQLLIFSVGFLGYFNAFLFSDVSMIFVILLELVIGFVVIFFVPKIRVKKIVTKGGSYFLTVKQPYIYYEMFIITGVTYFSLFNINPLVECLAEVNVFLLFFILFFQGAFLYKFYKLFIQVKIVNLFFIIFFGFFLLFFIPSTIIFFSIFLMFFMVRFFVLTQKYWHEIIPHSIQSVFFAERMITINSLKFIMCLIPIFEQFFLY